MTPKEAMRLYCQTFLRLVAVTHLDQDAEHALEWELDSLAPLVHKQLPDPELERWCLHIAQLLQHDDDGLVKNSAGMYEPLSGQWSFSEMLSLP